MQFQVLQINRWTAAAGVLLALALFLPACGGGGSSSTIAPAPDLPGYSQADLAGDWNGILSSGEGDVVAYMRFDELGNPLEIVDALGHHWSFLDSTASVSVTSTGQIQVSMSRPGGDQAEAAFAGAFSFGGLIQAGDYILEGGRDAGGIGGGRKDGTVANNKGASGKAMAGKGSGGGGGTGNNGAFDPPGPAGNPGAGQYTGSRPNRDGRRVGNINDGAPAGQGGFTDPGQHGLPDPPGFGGDPGQKRDGRDIDNYTLDNGPGGARNRGLDPWGKIGGGNNNEPPGHKSDPPPSVGGDSSSTHWMLEGNYDLSISGPGTYSAATHTQGRWAGTLTMADGTVHDVLLTVSSDGRVLEGNVGDLSVVSTPATYLTFSESSVGAIRDVVMPLSDGSQLTSSLLLEDPGATLIQGLASHSVAGSGVLHLEPLGQSSSL